MMFLLMVTLTSMLVAAVMSAVAWRIAREERCRSDARVAALAADIHAGPHLSTVPFALDDLELRPVHPIATSHDLFAVAQPATRSQWAAVVSIGALLIGTMTAVGILSSGASNISARGATTATPVVGSSQPGPAHPLELEALSHERDGDRLVVRGIVRNPGAGMPLERLTAVVFLFSREGGFLSSGRATIDPSTLRPGGESPFVVTVADAGDVGRYRVSFRTDENVVPHVDRRDAPRGQQ